jgi:hypothetical protein
VSKCAIVACLPVLSRGTGLPRADFGLIRGLGPARRFGAAFQFVMGRKNRDEPEGAIDETLCEMLLQDSSRFKVRIIAILVLLFLSFLHFLYFSMVCSRLGHVCDVSMQPFDSEFRKKKEPREQIPKV